MDSLGISSTPVPAGDGKTEESALVALGRGGSLERRDDFSGVDLRVSGKELSIDLLCGLLGR